MSINESAMDVYVPKWMGDEDGERVRETMALVVDAFTEIGEPVPASVLVYALTNLVTGVIANGVERAEGDQEHLLNIFTIASGASALMQDCLQKVVSNFSDDTVTLLGEAEGNA